MYNGRQEHIQTESIEGQSVKEESVCGYRNGESSSRHVENKDSSNKHSAEREMYKEQNGFCSSPREKKTIKLHLVPRL